MGCKRTLSLATSPDAYRVYCFAAITNGRIINRQGTLVFPSGVIGTLKIDINPSTDGEARAAAANTTEIDQGNAEKSELEKDATLIQLCRNGDFKEFLNYLEMNGRMSAQMINVTDASGKVNQSDTIYSDDKSETVKRTASTNWFEIDFYLFQSPLMLASLSGSASIVRELIKIPEIDLNISDN